LAHPIPLSNLRSSVSIDIGKPDGHLLWENLAIRAVTIDTTTFMLPICPKFKCTYLYAGSVVQIKRYLWLLSHHLCPRCLFQSIVHSHVVLINTESHLVAVFKKSG
jgi:hypothetical protein